MQVWNEPRKINLDYIHITTQISNLLLRPDFFFLPWLFTFIFARDPYQSSVWENVCSEPSRTCKSRHKNKDIQVCTKCTPAYWNATLWNTKEFDLNLFADDTYIRFLKGLTSGLKKIPFLFPHWLEKIMACRYKNQIWVTFTMLRKCQFVFRPLTWNRIKQSG